MHTRTTLPSRGNRVIGLATALAVSATFVAALTAAVPASRQDGGEDLALGAEIYRTQCQPCHGAQGKGDGPASRFVDPKPRDLTSAHWMYAIDKTLDQVIGVVSKGVEDTGMEPFDELLSAEEIRAVAAYVLATFAPKPETE